ncbi:MAG: dihydrofolate reductase, partial [Proteobacteria bacterium]|nr:dihydrofolate reductase [Pseudomonadota bacterium]
MKQALTEKSFPRAFLKLLVAGFLLVALPLADGIVLTEIGQAFEGDTKFPDWDRAAFRESQRQSHTSAGGLPY